MTAEDDELTGRLQQLFADARLDLPPRPDAAQAVVAGARRRRRRRTAAATAGGVLAVVLLVGGSLTIADFRSAKHQATLPAAGQPAFAPSASEPPSPPVEPASPTPMATPSAERINPGPDPRSADRSTFPTMSLSPESPRAGQMTGTVVGPSGYSRLRLGMTFEAAKATGMLAGTENPPPGCATYLLSEGSGMVSGVVISPTDGIVRFQVSGAHTPEGIRIGSTLAQLQSSYGDLARSSPGYTASAGPGGTYVFAVNDGGTVTSVQLTTPASAC